MRLIDADKLKEDINSRFLTAGEKRLLCRIVDKAPTINLDERDNDAFETGYIKGKWYECIPNCLKARHGEYVVYKIDYLLDNLAREIYLLKGTRMKGGADHG